MPLEVVYVFPLDEGAAVCGFEATVDGVRYVGRAMERDEAFKEYDDALEAGHGGFLLDEERADVFTASLGNLKPGSEVELSITYVTELAAEGEAVAVHAADHGVAPLRAGGGPDGRRADAGRDAEPAGGARRCPTASRFEMDVDDGRARSAACSRRRIPIEVELDGPRATVRLAQRERADGPRPRGRRRGRRPRRAARRRRAGRAGRGRVLLSFVPAVRAGGRSRPR